jgi:hydroxymethylpyrimidine pyrophosphatase-like HAD family hydrolase
MKTVLLLDIDGVVCLPQEPITEQMSNALKRFDVYYCTGNTYTKAVDLVGGGKIFACNGHELRDLGKKIWQAKEDLLPIGIERYLIDFMYDYRSYGNSIEWRTPAFINFSTIGRYAPWEVRKSHVPKWQDKVKRDLERNWDVSVSKGAVSVDIYSYGADKSRAAKWLNDNGMKFIFIGDKTAPGGNDYPVVEYCKRHEQNTALTSTGPKNTLEILKSL